MLRAEPKLNAAYAVELTDRERDALMVEADWKWIIDKYFADELRPGLLEFESNE